MCQLDIQRCWNIVPAETTVPDGFFLECKSPNYPVVGIGTPNPTNSRQSQSKKSWRKYVKVDAYRKLCTVVPQQKITGCLPSLQWNEEFIVYPHLGGGLFIICGSSMLDTPPKTNMTMEKQPCMKMYLLSKIVIFHCHVGFQGGNSDFVNRKAFSSNRGPVTPRFPRRYKVVDWSHNVEISLGKQQREKLGTLGRVIYQHIPPI